MRPIKFRGKGILARKGEWIYGFFKKNTHGDCYIEDEYGLSIAVDPDTVSQLVCINDNGIEIYEGDYIQDDEGVIWLVVYGNMSHGFLTHTEGILEHSEWIDDPDVCVVGNKWDTKLEDLYEKEGEDGQDMQNM